MLAVLASPYPSFHAPAILRHGAGEVHLYKEPVFIMATLPVDIIKFRFGTVVIASDGEAGSVAHVVVQPGQRVITHVGVKLPGNHTVAVPLERVMEGTSEEVHVSLTREGLLQAMLPTPVGATIFSRNTQVSIGKGHGALTQVSMAAASHALHHLATKQGLGGESLLSATWITSISDDGKSIAVTVPADIAPVAYRSDADLLDEVHTRLWNYPRLRVDMRAIDIRAVDGEVWLRGFVSSTLNRRIVEELLVGAKGLTTIHNELVADNELAVTVARALSVDPRTHGQRIGVYPTLGRVFLRGLASSQGAYDAATQIAAHAAGHATLVNEVMLKANAAFIPMLAPVTGTDDIVPGGD